MKIFVIALLLPFVACDCPSNEAPTCAPSDLMCGGEPDPYSPDGCPTPMYCLGKNPYERCSARAFCPSVCSDGQMSCSGGEDADGCPLPDICITQSENCYTPCPINCGPDQVVCGGNPGVWGECPTPQYCESVDYTAICVNVCPIEGSGHADDRRASPRV